MRETPDSVNNMRARKGQKEEEKKIRARKNTSKAGDNKKRETSRIQLRDNFQVCKSKRVGIDGDEKEERYRQA